LESNNSKSGTSIDNAIVIKNSVSHFEGIDAEYRVISEKYGKKGVDWNLKQQRLLHNKNQYYDMIEITLKNGSEIALYFDITDFFGKGF
jgi:hypothetical protein